MAQVIGDSDLRSFDFTPQRVGENYLMRSFRIDYQTHGSPWASQHTVRFIPQETIISREDYQLLERFAGKSIETPTFQPYWRGATVTAPNDIGALYAALTTNYPNFAYNVPGDYRRMHSQYVYFPDSYVQARSFWRGLSNLETAIRRLDRNQSELTPLISRLSAIPSSTTVRDYEGVGRWYPIFGLAGNQVTDAERQLRRQENIRWLHTISTGVMALIGGAVSFLGSAGIAGSASSVAGSTTTTTTTTTATSLTASQTFGTTTTSLQAARLGLATYSGTTPSMVSIAGASAQSSPLFGAQLGFQIPSLTSTYVGYAPTLWDRITSAFRVENLRDQAIEGVKSKVITEPINQASQLLSERSSVARALLQLSSGDWRGFGQTVGLLPDSQQSADQVSGVASTPPVRVETISSGGGGGSGSRSGTATSNNVATGYWLALVMGAVAVFIMVRKA